MPRPGRRNAPPARFLPPARARHPADKGGRVALERSERAVAYVQAAVGEYQAVPGVIVCVQTFGSVAAPERARLRATLARSPAGGPACHGPCIRTARAKPPAGSRASQA